MSIHPPVGLAVVHLLIEIQATETALGTTARRRYLRTIVLPELRTQSPTCRPGSVVNSKLVLLSLG